MVTLTTWCSGTGAAWAERRTDISVNGNIAVETAGLWVPVNAGGLPTRLGPDFVELYGVSAQGRKVSGRIAKATLPTFKNQKPWPIRRADLDVVGHVNNAALWSILSEVVSGSLSWAELTHHDAVALEDELELAWDEKSFWLSNGSQVKVSAEFALD
jgi:acyl-ACP thioesterase